VKVLTAAAVPQISASFKAIVLQTAVFFQVGEGLLNTSIGYKCMKNMPTVLTVLVSFSGRR
jgi:hypothetical protein